MGCTDAACMPPGQHTTYCLQRHNYAFFVFMSWDPQTPLLPPGQPTTYCLQRHILQGCEQITLPFLVFMSWDTQTPLLPPGQPTTYCLQRHILQGCEQITLPFLVFMSWDTQTPYAILPGSTRLTAFNDICCKGVNRSLSLFFVPGISCRTHGLGHTA